MSRLKDKVIVVTGGSGFLGKSFINQIEKEGGVAVNLDIQGEGEHFLKCDITKKEAIDEALIAIQSKYDRIDGWVNNAYPRTKDWGVKFEKIPLESWQKNVDDHLNSYFYCSQKVLEIMKSQRSGNLVNIGSIYGVLGPDFKIYSGTEMTTPAAYSAIKGGLINLSRYLASYYGEHGVRVNSISPGGIFDHQPKSFVDNYIDRTPLNRMGNPDDIAQPLAFLLSDEAKYITGHNLIVDGGWSIK